MVDSAHPGNTINETPAKEIRAKSKFKLERRRYQTFRFGELSPHFCTEAVPGDKLPLHSSHELRSYTLKAPLLSGLSMKKDYFAVPYCAIQPFNWDKIITNPNIGQDVPSDVPFYSSSKAVLDAIASIWSELSNFSSTDPLPTVLTAYLKSYVVLEYFLSSGSLLRNLGYDLSSCFSQASGVRIPSEIRNVFDYFSSQLLALIRSGLDSYNSIQCTIGGVNLVVDIVSLTSVSQYRLSFHDFLQRVREEPESLNITSVVVSSTPLTVSALLSLVADYQVDNTVNNNVPISWYRVAAYQLVAYHFFQNDKIDYVYNAQLYRQLMGDYIFSFQSQYDVFTVNGLSYQYDYLSKHYLDIFLGEFTSSGYNANDYAFAYLSGLLCFRRSLKFQDYFTGSRSQPLAVGDTTVAVNSNLVDVVDVTKKIQVQRFLNNVARIGRDPRHYMKGIFGVTPSYDFHDPAWLAHTNDSVGTQENENTGDLQFSAQNSVSSVFRSNAAKFEFTFHCEVNSIVIGITYFDIRRAYPHSNDRNIMMKDRFDLFLPDFQFIGDQPLKRFELGDVSNSPDDPFSYQIRDMQYKQTFDIACGGFVNDLPAWSFMSPRYFPQAIGPRFIRSSNDELDELYVSLTGNNLAEYFHFIVINTNTVMAVRPMVAIPQIL